jgi:hypothetical protein
VARLAKPLYAFLDSPLEEKYQPQPVLGHT